MSYSIQLAIRGLIGVNYDSINARLWALCPNVLEPARLDLPSEFIEEIEPHSPHLFFRGETSPLPDALPITLNAVRCDDANDLWRSIDVQNLDLRLEIPWEGEASLQPSGLLRLQTICDELSVDRVHSMLNPKVIEDGYDKNSRERYPTLSGRMSLAAGKMKLEERGCYQFSEIGNVYKLVKEILINIDDVTDPIVVHYRDLSTDLPDPQSKNFSLLSTSKLYMSYDNNPEVRQLGKACREGRDFAAHYHAIRSPLMIGAKPPIPGMEVDCSHEAPIGPADNAQCSPVEYRS